MLFSVPTSPRRSSRSEPIKESVSHSSSSSLSSAFPFLWRVTEDEDDLGKAEAFLKAFDAERRRAPSSPSILRALHASRLLVPAYWLGCLRFLEVLLAAFLPLLLKSLVASVEAPLPAPSPATGAAPPSCPTSAVAFPFVSTHAAAACAAAATGASSPLGSWHASALGAAFYHPAAAHPSFDPGVAAWASAASYPSLFSFFLAPFAAFSPSAATEPPETPASAPFLSAGDRSLETRVQQILLLALSMVLCSLVHVAIGVYVGHRMRRVAVEVKVALLAAAFQVMVEPDRRAAEAKSSGTKFKALLPLHAWGRGAASQGSDEQEGHGGTARNAPRLPVETRDCCAYPRKGRGAPASTDGDEAHRASQGDAQPRRGETGAEAAPEWSRQGGRTRWEESNERARTAGGRVPGQGRYGGDTRGEPTDARQMSTGRTGPIPEEEAAGAVRADMHWQTTHARERDASQDETEGWTATRSARVAREPCGDHGSVGARASDGEETPQGPHRRDALERVSTGTGIFVQSGRQAGGNLSSVGVAAAFSSSSSSASASLRSSSASFLRVFGRSASRLPGDCESPSRGDALACVSKAGPDPPTPSPGHCPDACSSPRTALVAAPPAELPSSLHAPADRHASLPPLSLPARVRGAIENAASEALKRTVSVMEGLNTTALDVANSAVATAAATAQFVRGGRTRRRRGRREERQGLQPERRDGRPARRDAHEQAGTGEGDSSFGDMSGVESELASSRDENGNLSDTSASWDEDMEARGESDASACSDPSTPARKHTRRLGESCRSSPSASEASHPSFSPCPAAGARLQEHGLASASSPQVGHRPRLGRKGTERRRSSGDLSAVAAAAAAATLAVFRAPLPGSSAAGEGDGREVRHAREAGASLKRQASGDGSQACMRCGQACGARDDAGIWQSGVDEQDRGVDQAGRGGGDFARRGGAWARPRRGEGEPGQLRAGGEGGGQPGSCGASLTSNCPAVCTPGELPVRSEEPVARESSWAANGPAGKASPFPELSFACSLRRCSSAPALPHFLCDLSSFSSPQQSPPRDASARAFEVPSKASRWLSGASFRNANRRAAADGSGGELRREGGDFLKQGRQKRERGPRSGAVPVELTTLLSVDGERIQGGVCTLHEAWATPLTLVMTLSLIYVQIPKAFLPGLIVFAICLLLQVLLTRRLRHLTRRLMVCRDARLHACREFFAQFRHVKLLCLERFAYRRLRALRQHELQRLNYFFICTPLVVKVVVLFSLVLSHQKLTAASNIFASLALIDRALNALNSLPLLLSEFTAAAVSFTRFSVFLTNHWKEEPVGAPPAGPTQSAAKWNEKLREETRLPRGRDKAGAESDGGDGSVADAPSPPLSAGGAQARRPTADQPVLETATAVGRLLASAAQPRGVRADNEPPGERFHSISRADTRPPGAGKRRTTQSHALHARCPVLTGDMSQPETAQDGAGSSVSSISSPAPQKSPDGLTVDAAAEAAAAKARSVSPSFASIQSVSTTCRDRNAWPPGTLESAGARREAVLMLSRCYFSWHSLTPSELAAFAKSFLSTSRSSLSASSSCAASSFSASSSAGSAFVAASPPPSAGALVSSSKVVLKNINFSVHAGELTVIVGPSGGGKSSLLCALVSELVLLHGSVAVAGDKPEGREAKRARAALSSETLEAKETNARLAEATGPCRSLHADPRARQAPPRDGEEAWALHTHARNGNDSEDEGEEEEGEHDEDEEEASPVGYAAQQPWLFRGTVRENILFGRPFDADAYHKVLTACALHSDLEKLACKDMTDLDSGGQCLSGGQRARVGLARAIYGASLAASSSSPRSSSSASSSPSSASSSSASFSFSVSAPCASMSSCPSSTPQRRSALLSAAGEACGGCGKSPKGETSPACRRPEGEAARRKEGGNAPRLFLIDDPFSCLDAVTATWIWRHVFAEGGILCGHTVVLVTHAAFLSTLRDPPIASLWYMEGGHLTPVASSCLTAAPLPSSLGFSHLPLAPKSSQRGARSAGSTSPTASPPASPHEAKLPLLPTSDTVGLHAKPVAKGTHLASGDVSLPEARGGDVQRHSGDTSSEVKAVFKSSEGAEIPASSPEGGLRPLAPVCLGWRGPSASASPAVSSPGQNMGHRSAKEPDRGGPGDACPERPSLLPSAPPGEPSTSASGLTGQFGEELTSASEARSSSYGSLVGCAVSRGSFRSVGRSGGQFVSSGDGGEGPRASRECEGQMGGHPARLFPVSGFTGTGAEGARSDSCAVCSRGEEARNTHEDPREKSGSGARFAVRTGGARSGVYTPLQGEESGGAQPSSPALLQKGPSSASRYLVVGGIATKAREEARDRRSAREKEKAREGGAFDRALWGVYIRAAGDRRVAGVLVACMLHAYGSAFCDYWVKCWTTNRLPFLVPLPWIAFFASLFSSPPSLVEASNSIVALLRSALPAVPSPFVFSASRFVGGPEAEQAPAVSLEVEQRWKDTSFLFVYLLVACISILLCVSTTFGYVRCGLSAASALHERMLASLLRSGSSWVERTPLGRILSRCSDDIFSVDEQIPSALHLFTVIGVTLSAKLLMLAANAPLLLVVLLPVGVFFWRTSAHFRSSARDLKRLEMLTRSPLHERLTEASTGGATIRAFGAQKRFYEAYVEKLGAHRRTVQRNQLVHAWLSLRLQGSGALAQGAFLFIVVFPVFLVPQRLRTMQGELAAVLALGLYTTMPLVRLLTALITSAIRADMQMVAVERLTEYANIPPEDDSYDPLYCRPVATALADAASVAAASSRPVSALRAPVSLASSKPALTSAAQPRSEASSPAAPQATPERATSSSSSSACGAKPAASDRSASAVCATPKHSAFPLFLPFLTREASCPNLVSLGKKKPSATIPSPSPHTPLPSSSSASSSSCSSLFSSLPSSLSSSSSAVSSSGLAPPASPLSPAICDAPASASLSPSSADCATLGCADAGEKATDAGSLAEGTCATQCGKRLSAKAADTQALPGEGRSAVPTCAPPEKQRSKTFRKALRFDVGLPAAPAIAWPTAGRIDFDDVCVEYGPGLAPALSHASFTIYPGETVAMVGRTGAGKSSVLLALARMVNYTGSIKIDGIDTRRMPRHILRSRLALVPQNPVLFSGSLRSNLDAERLRTNEQIFKILDLCKLGNVVRALPDGLDTRLSARAECADVEFRIKRSRRHATGPRHQRRSMSLQSPPSSASSDTGHAGASTGACAAACSSPVFPDAVEKLREGREAGRNTREYERNVLPGSIRLSPGQQQLLCFCRALLRGAPIMCLDEVNCRFDAGVEEDIISSALRTKLRPCTVLMISHTLEQLRSLCDRVIAFYSSRVVEIGSPEALLDNPNSYFSKLYHAGTTEGAHGV
ncbi:putative ABC transporter [Neospora caninum Liverpool]|uniref:Putative ABC transporter n=1 Tax=Neospora caninum (strain Liverpool) TaxID=572307 RepID=F0V7W8_NEOCL|nr:putative ABC transporter [Neospora caninum Liverpool]CBZ49809.1 putative ABC transporter [Neospora caninum Liverpool]|eukprot:XP_003879844.1 putative ABC transporter [Neospora caninum Liverpool]